jgi:hypothetical protein
MPVISKIPTAQDKVPMEKNDRTEILKYKKIYLTSIVFKGIKT